jgi:MoaA/NifB/PqqE/SkfB family radical SAM enzyme
LVLLNKIDAIKRNVLKICRIPADLPTFVQIEITNICNLDCPMCVRNFIELERRHMPIDGYRQVIDRLQGVKTVTLTGYGEPLMHPQIIEAIQYGKQRGLEMQVTSNGLLLGKTVTAQQLIDSGLDAISFSIESVTEEGGVGHDSLDALERIKEMVLLRSSTGSKTPLITVQSLMMKGKEAQLYQVIHWAAQNGIDRVNIARFDLNTLQDVERPNRHEEDEIFRELGKLRKQYGLRIDCFQDQFFTGWKGAVYRHGKHFMGFDSGCVRLLDFVYVNLAGQVRPCCALVDVPMGNLLERDLKSIWSSHKFNHFRKNFEKTPWCSKCDIFTLRQKG